MKLVNLISSKYGGKNKVDAKDNIFVDLDKVQCIYPKLSKITGQEFGCVAVRFDDGKEIETLVTMEHMTNIKLTLKDLDKQEKLKEIDKL